MTYKYFLFLNDLKDGMDAYKAYLEQHDSLYGIMPEKMKAQHRKATYHLRFINHAWI